MNVYHVDREVRIVPIIAFLYHKKRTPPKPTERTGTYCFAWFKLWISPMPSPAFLLLGISRFISLLYLRRGWSYKLQHNKKQAEIMLMTRSFTAAALWALFALLGGSPLLAQAETSAEGLAFLATKRAELGVVETSSGLLYKEIRAGVGKTPTIDSPCSCHYSGTLIDGSKLREFLLPLCPHTANNHSSHHVSSCSLFVSLSLSLSRIWFIL